jgi:hypothetical protein
VADPNLGRGRARSERTVHLKLFTPPFDSGQRSGSARTLNNSFAAALLVPAYSWVAGWPTRGAAGTRRRTRQQPLRNWCSRPRRWPG